ncbi:DUF7561 family protein [Halorhabdus salina]|uniref:DUF7561 family protein n=1 Tax=Halorhabdus salina TaxID=2750670 RepID=UPI0015EF36B1|nr:hypothetical protein [Halorhabdus salina]
MTTDPCDGCGREVRIAGGIGNMWSTDQSATGGMTLELADGTEHFLCHDCIEALPDDREVHAKDVKALEARDG